MTPWRELHQKLQRFTYVSDVEAYADVFDAVDAARLRGRGYTPGAAEFQSLGKVAVIDDDGNEEASDFVVSRMPVTPVRAANTVRLCVGLLQDGLWRRAEEWFLRVEPRPGRDVLLPDVAVLLARKLKPTLNEIADVARFLLTPSPSVAPGEESYDEPSLPILRFIEKHVVPPAAEPVRAALQEAQRRLDVLRALAVRIRHKSGGKPQTTRFEKWNARLAHLVGE